MSRNEFYAKTLPFKKTENTPLYNLLIGDSSIFSAIFGVVIALDIKNHLMIAEVLHPLYCFVIPLRKAI